MKKHIVRAACILGCLLGLMACTTLQDGVVTIDDRTPEFANIEQLDKDLVALDAASYMTGEQSAQSIQATTAACQELLQKINEALLGQDVSKALEARLLAMQGRVLLLDGKKSKAKVSYDDSVAAYKGDSQTIILGSRLGLIINLSEYKTIGSNGALVLLEIALQQYTEGMYLESVASFDEAFLSLPAYYRSAYNGIRDRAWELRTLTGGSSASVNALLAQKQITVGQMMLITQEQSNLLFNYTSGKTLSEHELFKKLTGAGLVTPVSQAFSASTVYGREDVVTRIMCARFLWNLYNSYKGTKHQAAKYSQSYAAAGMETPVPDVPVRSPDFDAALGCVEKEIMDLRDGVHFYPDEKVSAVDFNEYLSRIK